MSSAAAPASIREALAVVLDKLRYLAAAGLVAWPAEVHAECLRGLEQAEAVSTGVRAWTLGAFTNGQGYSADADYSPRAWLMHRTGITRGAAIPGPASSGTTTGCTKPCVCCDFALCLTHGGHRGPWVDCDGACLSRRSSQWGLRMCRADARARLEMWDRCTFTVPGAMNNWRAMASLRNPWPTSRMTSSSPGVRLAHPTAVPYGGPYEVAPAGPERTITPSCPHPGAAGLVGHDGGTPCRRRRHRL